MKPHSRTQENMINQIEVICIGLLHKVNNNDYYGTKAMLIKKAGRMVSDVLINGSVWSKLLTPEAVKEINNGGKETTFEHPKSKQQCGERFIKNVLRSNKVPSETSILKFFRSSNRTIKSLKSENTRLRNHQNSKDFTTWMGAYANENINYLYLVPDNIKQPNVEIKNNGTKNLVKISLTEADEYLK